MTKIFDEGIREQHAILGRRLAEGMPRAGWKICVNDARMQKKLGIDASFVGFLDGARRLADGDVWPVEAGSVLGVEPEFALRFNASVSAGDDRDAIRRAVGGVAPAIEIVDWKGAKFDLGALASSSSFHAGFVVGKLHSLDALPAITPSCPAFLRGHEVLGVGDRDLVPVDLMMLIARVAAFLAAHGQCIEAGDWLLCGACTNPARVERGDTVEANFATLGSVKVTFGD